MPLRISANLDGRSLSCARPAEICPDISIHAFNEPAQMKKTNSAKKVWTFEPKRCSAIRAYGAEVCANS